MKYFDEEITTVIRAQSQEAEKKRRLSAEVLQLIYDHALFKLFVPANMNGAEMELPRAICTFEEASFIDGSFGWLVTIGSGGGYFAGVSNQDVSRRLFSPDDAIVAGSGYVGGHAAKTDNGYLISGSWKFCSGADFATIFTANARLEDGTVRSFIFTPDQVEIDRDWDAFGLKATGSHTIRVKDALVPEDMTFDIDKGQRTQDAPIFRYPFLTFAETSFAAVNIGICRHYLAEARGAINVYKRIDDPEMMLRYERVNNVINTQEDILTVEVNKFHEAVETSWELTLHGGIVSEAVYSDAGRWAKKVTATALECAQRIYPYLGLTAAMESTELNRCWRDLHTASQHVLLKEF